MAKKQASKVVRGEVVTLAKGGDGLVRATDGGRGSFFVPATAPGDVIEAAVDAQGRGRLLRVISPSPERILAPCPHANDCGGCDWMHLKPETQRSARSAIVHDALRRAGIDVPTIRVHAAASTLQYRGRARFAVQATQRGITIGLRAARSHKIVPIQSCLVLLPALNQAREALVSWLHGSAGSGELSVALGLEARPAIHLTWHGELAPSVFAIAQQRVEEGHWAGVSVWLAGAVTPAVLGDPRGVTQGADGLAVVIPAGGFMQANAHVNLELVRHVVAEAALEGRPGIELFSGAGNFTVCLAAQTDELETVELDAPAVDAARLNLKQRALRARQRVGDAEQAAIRPRARVAVLDPPRTGAPGASARLAASKVRRVVMVSCDPATLARDASTLQREGKFQLEHLDVFDMFPQTSHVETVASFRRNR